MQKILIILLTYHPMKLSAKPRIFMMMKAFLCFAFLFLVSVQLHAQAPYAFTSYDISKGNASSQPERFTPFGRQMVFSAINPIIGREPWISNGTKAGTFMLKDIATGDHSGNPTGFTAMGNKLYFAATDTLSEALWVTDGTKKGTRMVKRIIPFGSIYTDETQIAAVNNKLLLRGQDAAGDIELWVSDGTDTGTHLLKNINPYGSSYPLNMFVYNGNAYFTVDDGVYGNRTWVSDGTAEGTHILLPGDPKATPLLSKNCLPVVCNGKMYFVARDDAHGTELWVTDGTEAGTHIIRDCPDCDGADAHSPVVMNGKVYFVGNTKISTGNLWVTDGTADGTSMVYSPNPTGHSDIADIAVLSNKLYFNAYEETHGKELWTSDGTPSGSRLFKDLNPGEQSAYPAQFYIFGSKMLFTAVSEGKKSYYYTDGKTVGQLKPAGVSKVIPHDLTGAAANGIFYFVADYADGAGYDLWSIQEVAGQK
ncbi:MAG: hypothetical protein ACTHKV_07250 [Flavipsychrobacter sp.]